LLQRENDKYGTRTKGGLITFLSSSIPYIYSSFVRKKEETNSKQQTEVQDSLLSSDSPTSTLMEADPSSVLSFTCLDSDKNCSLKIFLGAETPTLSGELELWRKCLSISSDIYNLLPEGLRPDYIETCYKKCYTLVNSGLVDEYQELLAALSSNEVFRSQGDQILTMFADSLPLIPSSRRNEYHILQGNVQYLLTILEAENVCIDNIINHWRNSGKAQVRKVLKNVRACIFLVQLQLIEAVRKLSVCYLIYEGWISYAQSG
jgi:hypothetical protein